MSGAPAWVSYAALALSAGALVVSVLAYRAGAPRLSLRAAKGPQDEFGDPIPWAAPYELTVVNAGRAAVSIEGFWVTPYGERKPLVQIHDVAGPPLPYRLEAHSTASWLVDALPPARAYDAAIKSGRLRPNSSWPSRFRFTVAAGNGKHTSTGATVDSLRLLADGA
jgi:hypothetical protein